MTSCTLRQDATAYTFVGQIAEEAFHHAARRRWSAEVDVEVAGACAATVGRLAWLGAGVVVADEMHLEVCWHLPVDEGEELDPLLVAVARHARAEDVAGQCAQGRE